TARDQATLGRAIQDRFPNYYQYFATRTFEYRGKSIRNHNHLLGVVDGLDGIKTGYIHDSGFNIVTSVRRANHHVVAVVFGGRTAEARDARARSLIDNNINIAAVKRTAPLVVEGWQTAVARKDSKEDDRTGSAPVRVASAAQQPAPSVTDAPAPGSTDPIKPVTVKTVAVQPGTIYAASLSPVPSDNRQLTPVTGIAANVTTIAVRSEPPAPAPRAIAAPAPTSPPAPPPAAAAPPASPAPVTPPAAEPPAASVQPAKVGSAGSSAPVPTASAASVTKPRGGWLIQIGALPDENEARQRLETAQTKAKSLLAKADPFTERTEKGDKVLFRARFAGLEKDQAEA